MDYSDIILPEPEVILNPEMAEEAIEKIKQVQEVISKGFIDEAIVTWIVAETEGLLAYLLNVHAKSAVSRAAVFDSLIAPLSEWGLFVAVSSGDFVENPESERQQLLNKLMYMLGALRSKYQYLNPNNR